MEDVLKTLDYTKETKLLEKDVIQKKGVDIEDSTTFRSYVDKIMKIDSGADSFIIQNNYYDMIKEVYANYKRDGLDLMYSLESKLNKGSLLSFALVYDYKGSDLSYYVPTLTNGYNDYVMYLDINGNNLKESNVLEKYQYKDHDYAIIIGHTIDGFLEDNKIDYIQELANMVGSNDLDYPYLLLNTDYDITMSSFLGNFKYDFTDSSELNYDNYTPNETISIYLEHHDFGPKFIKRALSKLSSFGGMIEVRLNSNHNVLGQFDFGDQVFTNGTILTITQPNDNYCIFRGNLTFEGTPNSDFNYSLTFYDSSSGSTSDQTSCFIGDITFENNIQLKTISFMKGNLYFNDLDNTSKVIKESDDNIYIISDCPRYIDGNIEVKCGYRNDVLSGASYGNTTYLLTLNSCFGINGNMRIICNNCSFVVEGDTLNYLRNHLYVYGNNIDKTKHSFDLFSGALNFCRELKVDNISLSNYSRGTLFSNSMNRPKISLVIDKFIDVLSGDIYINLTSFDLIKGYFRAVNISNYCFDGLSNQRFDSWRQVLLKDSSSEFDLFRNYNNYCYKHFSGLNQICLTSDTGDIRTINKLNLDVNNISHIEFGGKINHGTHFEYLPVNINNLNLVNVNRLTRLDCINFTTIDRKFNEGSSINIYLNDKYSIYPLNLVGYVLNGNNINIIISDYSSRIIPLYLLLGNSNNGNVVVKNKLPNNCIEYIYENMEEYNSDNSEYKGDHKFSCDLVHESDESKYIELFARKGWIFEKYGN